MRGKAMMGLSGTLVDQDQGVPTLADMATGLSRIPRFGGQTLVPWNVAHHSLVAMALASVDGYNDMLSENVLFMALHDAHESLTMDVPTAFKTPDMKALQARLDSRIYKAFGLTGPETATDRNYIKAVDLRCLVNEAKVVTPPATADWIAEYAGFTADEDALRVVRSVLLYEATPQQAGSLYYEWTAALINHHQRTHVVPE